MPCDDEEEQVDDDGDDNQRGRRTTLSQSLVPEVDADSQVLTGPSRGLLKWLNAIPSVSFQLFRQLLPVLTCLL